MKKILSILVLFFWVAACAPKNNMEQGALYGAGGGAALGALVGQVAGKNTETTLIGAAVGAALGSMVGAGVGKSMDEQERRFREALASSKAAQVRREGNLISIAFKGDFLFETDSAMVRRAMYRDLDRIARVMREYPQTVIQVCGHTDSTGSAAHNMELSRRRAEAVQTLLYQRGVQMNRMEVAAFGENSPVASNETAFGRQLNRRVELRVAPAPQTQQY